VLAQAGAEEGILVVQVPLDPANKQSRLIPDFEGRVYPGSAGRDLVKVDESLGWISYTLSATRLNKAQRISE
jgi:hypothetical protein